MIRPKVRRLIDETERHGEYCRPNDYGPHGGSPFYRLPNGTQFSMFKLLEYMSTEFEYSTEEQQYAIDAINRMEAALDFLGISETYQDE